MLLVAAFLALAAAVPATAGVKEARFADPTWRYDHHIFGKLPDWESLHITGHDGQVFGITLPETHVFEDLEPRLLDVNGDGDAEVVVVLTDVERGASLAIYDEAGLVARTEPIGQSHRWLAPVGVGDFDDDGRVEIAYVDRPHLKRDLVFLRLDGDRLTEVGRSGDVTNHRIGMPSIFGGVRNCGTGDEAVLLSGDQRRIVAVRLGAAPRDLGHATWADLARALDCGL